VGKLKGTLMFSHVVHIFCFRLVYLITLSVTNFLQSDDWMVINSDLERMVGLQEVIVA
jgi:hypothetical protein